MGTRANVVIRDGKTNLVRIYRQFDGYPTGLGQDLKDILLGGRAKIVNGYGSGMQAPEVFNGLGCLAAYLIGELKDKKIGNVYIEPANLKPDRLFIEYEYILREVDKAVHVKVLGHGGKELYDGPLADADMQAIEASESEE